MTLRQGDCIQLSQEGAPAAQIYQGIGMDAGHDSCWLGRCPLPPGHHPEA